MKKLTQIISLSIALSFSSLANASLIENLFAKIKKNETIHEIKTMSQHEAVLSIFRDIEFREGVVEISYEEAAFKNDICVIRTTYLLEKENIEGNKEIIKKMGINIEKIEENKDYALTLNYIYGHKAQFILKEYIES